MNYREEETLYGTSNAVFNRKLDDKKALRRERKLQKKLEKKREYFMAAPAQMMFEGVVKDPFQHNYQWIVNMNAPHKVVDSATKLTPETVKLTIDQITEMITNFYRKVNIDEFSTTEPAKRYITTNGGTIEAAMALYMLSKKSDKFCKPIPRTEEIAKMIGYFTQFQGESRLLYAFPVSRRTAASMKLINPNNGKLHALTNSAIVTSFNSGLNQWRLKDAVPLDFDISKTKTCEFIGTIEGINGPLSFNKVRASQRNTFIACVVDHEHPEIDAHVLIIHPSIFLPPLKE